jgi:uncharacterized protein (DUF4415 family)/uncharacterized DUF497 family protein
MDIAFDPAKDQANIAKHGLSLALASELDWNAALVWVDERQNYGELRMVALAPKSPKLFMSRLSIADMFAESSACAAPTNERRITMSTMPERSHIRIPTAAEDRAITAAANADPEAQPLSPQQLRDMFPLRTLRGRPKSDHKKLLVSVRYSPEVIDYFKSTGEGWQSRMDGVLRQYVAQQADRR